MLIVAPCFSRDRIDAIFRRMGQDNEETKWQQQENDNWRNVSEHYEKCMKLVGLLLS